MNQSWYRRNRGWLLVLPFLLALAVLASSQRMLSLYLPWEATSPVHPSDDGVAELRHDYRLDKTTFQLEADVHVVDARIVDEHEGEIAAPGAKLWLVELGFEAPPEQVLTNCEVELVADGVHYGADAGKATRGDHAPMLFGGFRCVPADASGPRHELDGNSIVPAEDPRPEQWTTKVSFAVPDDVTPEAVRVWWHTPNYALLPLDD